MLQRSFFLLTRKEIKWGLGIWGNSHICIEWWGCIYLLLSLLGVQCHPSNNYEELIIHMALWIKAAHSQMSHGVKDSETVREELWGYGNWAIKPGQRDWKRLPRERENWTVEEGKEEEGGKTKPDEGNSMRKGTEACHAQADQRMTRPPGHGRGGPWRVGGGHRWTWAKVS